MKSRKIGLAALTAAVLGSVAFAWYDTAPNRAALAELPQYKGLIEATVVDIEHDLDFYSKCINLDGDGLQYSNAERACLIEAMHKVKTHEGAYAFSLTARSWLLKNPGDEGVRDAALTAIDNGRAQLLAIKPWSHDAMQAVYKSHDQSVLMSIRNGKLNLPDLFSRDAKQLDEAEIYVRLPEVSKRQEAWLSKAIIEKTDRVATK